jgi:hypothetical protein
VSRITKIVAAVLATVLVAVGAIVVYRETDLLTGSLVVLAALMIVGLLVRRVAVREEKEGMAEWEHESRASAAAAEDLFGDWKISSPRAERTPNPPAPMSPSPTVAPPVPGATSRPAPPLPVDAEVPEPIDPSVAVSRPIRTSEDRSEAAARTSDFFGDNDPTEPAPIDRAPNRTEARTPAYAGAAPAPAAASNSRFLIDWTGQGRPVDEQVRTSDDIMRASDVTALPTAAADPAAGTELARLLAKVEARLRDYD